MKMTGLIEPGVDYAGTRSYYPIVSNHVELAVSD